MITPDIWGISAFLCLWALYIEEPCLIVVAIGFALSPISIWEPIYARIPWLFVPVVILLAVLIASVLSCIRERLKGRSLASKAFFGMVMAVTLGLVAFAYVAA
jgi:hypothetical protein